MKMNLRIGNMLNETLQLYERRIDNCWQAAEHFEEDTWGKQFWTQNAMYLLRKLNSDLNGEKNEIYVDFNDVSKPNGLC